MKQHAALQETFRLMATQSIRMVQYSGVDSASMDVLARRTVPSLNVPGALVRASRQGPNEIHVNFTGKAMTTILFSLPSQWDDFQKNIFYPSTAVSPHSPRVKSLQSPLHLSAKLQQRVVTLFHNDAPAATN